MLLGSAKKFRHLRLKELDGRDRRVKTSVSLPTVTVDTTQRTGTSQYAWDRTNSRPNPSINFAGTRSQCVHPRGITYPTRDFAFSEDGLGVGNGYGQNNNKFAVFFSGTGIDVIAYQNEAIDIWVDDQFLGAFRPYVRKADTAQAGATSSITLATGASSTDGYYVGYYVTITAGTGSGQTRRVSGYVGSTRVATVSSAWTTTPDATSVYNITENPNGWATEASGGSTMSYIHLDWTSDDIYRLDVVGSGCGFIVPTTGVLTPAPARGRLPVIVVGDSFPAGSANPRSGPSFTNCLQEALGLAEVTNASAGGTGWLGSYTPTGSMSIGNRVAPPAESRMFQASTSAGTFTISITYGGITSTTSALSYNASIATMYTALNALSVVTAAGGSVDVGGGIVANKFMIAITGMPGATISIDGSGLTGSITDLGVWTGDVDRLMPRDIAGNALPFVLLVMGSGNDSSKTDAQISAESTRIATEILSRFPTAITFFTGVVGDGLTGSTGAVTTAMTSRNTAYKAGALLLPKINGSVPFVDTYADVTATAWLNGAGSIAAPVAGTTSKFKSLTNSGHPTGDGVVFLANRLADAILNIAQP